MVESNERFSTVGDRVRSSKHETIVTLQGVRTRNTVTSTSFRRVQPSNDKAKHRKVLRMLRNIFDLLHLLPAKFGEFLSNFADTIDALIQEFETFDEIYAFICLPVD